MGKYCFVCKVKLGTLMGKWALADMQIMGKPVPDGMGERDNICERCWQKLKGERQPIQDQKKAEFASNRANLDERVGEYKRRWDKDGVVQFKNEKIAILHRMWGSQVQFIVAFDDLTGEGYELKAIDEGKQASGGIVGGVVGGVDSYYYFQKLRSHHA